MTAGVALAGAAVARFARARTTIVPHATPAALVTGGAYRLSRNPMYTALGLVYVGAAPAARAYRVALDGLVRRP